MLESFAANCNRIYKLDINYNNNQRCTGIESALLSSTESFKQSVPHRHIPIRKTGKYTDRHFNSVIIGQKIINDKNWSNVSIFIAQIQ